MGLDLDYINGQTPFDEEEKDGLLILTTLLTSYPAIQNKYYKVEIHTEVTMVAFFGDLERGKLFNKYYFFNI
jgi:hypothetical protein